MVGIVWKAEEKEKEGRGSLLIFEMFYDVDTDYFSPQKEKKRCKILVLLKRFRLTAKHYSNCNSQLNSLHMEAAESQTLEIKEKGKYLSEILFNSYFEWRWA